MKKMTKQEIIEQITEQTDLRRSEAKKAVESMMDILSQAFAKGNNVYLRGFGTLWYGKPRRRRRVLSPRGRNVLFRPTVP